ncbi:Gfo/Idh/MocA family oxidoreductase [Candidatus Synechococcus calcipolaris G9]|uniref:Gfo/Idh/MocA family oxidoreductase n=1 Tax=Candidatus Synechococcus calcipolaris G9 TaxID=1497997 RepID=A0ABT6F3M6_9SYNE|nr:Gfo/Idh/MocA family oxidoreductase [Candidatus Synechococcus calcipolaris]MDG2992386.1 Gfo/Idh/MocA family oxidoreductase [Candidatus Synechococcus calcipolaris G9]
MKVLIIGYGSIGQRHARLLTELGCQVGVFSRRSINYFPSFQNITQALIDWQPNYVVVASRTSEHFNDIKSLVANDFRGVVMVEKPLFDKCLEIPFNNFNQDIVGYNLRFHPLLQKLKQILDDKLDKSEVLMVHIYVGSYLPNWRTNRDYRVSYSAQRSQGGGVLRDLSHELDYVFWLFGAWRRLTAIGGKFSSLEIDSEDGYSILMETESCPMISIHLNYLDKIPRREISINMNNKSIYIDLLNNIISINGKEKKLLFMQKDMTYRAQHQAIVSNKNNVLCDFKQAVETLKTIEASEKASKFCVWIKQ